MREAPNLAPAQSVTQRMFHSPLPFAVQPSLETVTAARYPHVPAEAPSADTGILRTIRGSTRTKDYGKQCCSLHPRQRCSPFCGCLADGTGGERNNSRDGPDFGSNLWDDLHSVGTPAARSPGTCDG